MRIMTIRNAVGYLLVGCIFVALLFLRAERHPHQVFAQASSGIAQQSEQGRAQYVGDAACEGCHQTEAQSYVHTSHHLTSQPATKETILGSFANGHNLLTI